MTSENQRPVSSPEEEIDNCIVLFSHILNPLSFGLRRELIKVMHALMKREVSVSNAKDLADNIVMRIETELGCQHLVCDVATKEFVDCLRKLNLVEEAVTFLEDRKARIAEDDFGTLLIEAMLHDLSGNYSRGLEPKNKMIEIAQKLNDPVLLTLAHAKLACSLWHLQKPDEARCMVREALTDLENCGLEVLQSDVPFTGSTLRLLDAYKTIAYLHRLVYDRKKCIEYLSKALAIVKKDKFSHFQEIKLGSMIGCEYSNLSRKELAKEHSQRAYHLMANVQCNDNLMSHHAVTVIAVLARIAHTYQTTELYKEEAFTIRENLYKVGVKFLEVGHPGIARIAADTAYLCRELKKFKDEELYIERAETGLEDCEYRNDIEKTKLYVRELSDAMKSLGFLFMKRSEFSRAEKFYQETLRINELVYGSEHQRVARIYLSFSHLYTQWSRFPEALEQIQKCQEINLRFAPNDLNIQKKLKKDIKKILLLQKKANKNNY